MHRQLNPNIKIICLIAASSIMLFSAAAQEAPGPKFLLHRTTILVNVNSTASMMVRMPNQTYNWGDAEPTALGLGSDVRIALQFGKRENPSKSAFNAEFGIGLGNYGGRSVWGNRAPEGRDPVMGVIRYDRYKVLQFTRAFGRLFEISNSIFGFFMVTNYHYIMNHQEIDRSSIQSISIIQVYPGLELRWYTRELKVINIHSLCLSAQRTFSFLPPMDNALQHHLFSFKINFYAHDF